MDYRSEQILSELALKSQIVGQMNSRCRLTLPGDKNIVASGLFTAYKCEVELRNRQFIMSPILQTQIMRVADWLTNPRGKFGLLLAGTCGNGKTTMTKAIMRLLEVLQLKCLRMDASNSYSLVRPSFRTAKLIVSDYMESPEQWAKDCETGVLVIDDLGNEPTEVEKYRNIYTPIIDLIGARYDRQLCTIATTNLKPADLMSKYGERTSDRLAEMMDCIGFSNPSYRTL